MKAKIVSWTDGSISLTTYEVVLKEKDNNRLIVGKNYDGKPIIDSYKGCEVMFLD